MLCMGWRKAGFDSGPGGASLVSSPAGADLLSLSCQRKQAKKGAPGMATSPWIFVAGRGNRLGACVVAKIRLCIVLMPGLLLRSRTKRCRAFGVARSLLR
ncbi:hypothetical protein CJO94_14065 [Ralstonia solanacearum]|nr:hypothetical protein CJO94_14065 [Ralstonia solanacearum]